MTEAAITIALPSEVIESIKSELLKQLRSELLLSEQERQREMLWDAHNIADYLNIGVRSVQNHILKSRDFPKTVPLPTGGRRYLPAEVKAWAKRRKSAH